MEATERGGSGIDIDRSESEVPGVLLEDVIEQVKDAFYLVAAERGADLIPLESVKLTLTSVLEWTISGGPKFKIPFVEIEIELGHKITQERTQTIEIELKPPKAEAKGRVASESLAPQIAAALRLIRETVEAGMARPPALELAKGSILLNFVVTRDSSAKLIVFSGDRNTVTTQTLLVTVGAAE